MFFLDLQFGAEQTNPLGVQERLGIRHGAARSAPLRLRRREVSTEIKPEIDLGPRLTRRHRYRRFRLCLEVRANVVATLLK